MRALVVGGSGFIGLHVVDALLAAGAAVRVTRRGPTPTMALRKRPVELVTANMDDRDSLVSAMRGCDVVFVVAGYYPRYSTDPAASLQIGVSGLRNACDAAIEVGTRMIYTSSVAALGRPRDGAVADELDVAPPDPAEGVYPTVKKAMERELDLARERGLDAVSLLLGGCLGAGDHRLGTNGLLVVLLRKVLPFRMDGWVNVLSVRDAAKAHIAAIGAPGARYCVGGHDVHLDELFAHAAARYGVSLDAPRVSIERARELADQAERDAEPRKGRVAVPRELVDLVAMGKPVSRARAERELGMTWTSLDDALDESKNWLARCGVVRSNDSPRHQKETHDAR